MRQDKRKWVDHLAMEAEEAAHNGRMKEVYDITKTLSNDKRKSTKAVKDKCGNLITEGLARRKRWKKTLRKSLIIKSRHEYNKKMACQIIQNILGTRECAKNVEAGTDH